MNKLRIRRTRPDNRERRSLVHQLICTGVGHRRGYLRIRRVSSPSFTLRRRLRSSVAGAPCGRVGLPSDHSSYSAYFGFAPGARQAACPLCARSDGEPQGLTVTHGHTGRPPACGRADRQARTRSLPSGWCRPPRCSIVSAESAASRPSRFASLDTTATARGMAAIEEDWGEPGHGDHLSSDEKPPCH